MNRSVVVGAIGAGAALALVLGLAATSLGSPTPRSSESPSGQPSGPTPAPTATPTTTVTATATPAPTPTASPSPTPVASPTTVAAPLTGQLVAPDVARRHPIAVMIDDLLPARPQSGMSSADVVWQAPAEGGIPRYMAIFQTRLPEAIGPVRSSRYYYIAWAAEWHAVYAHSGGSPQALDTLRAKGSGQWVYNGDEFRYGGRYFHRITQRPPPHNVYTDGQTLRKLGNVLGAKDGPYQAAWSFAPDAPLYARPFGGSISMSYPANTISYSYDRASNTYLRSVTGEGKEVDAATGKRVAPKNVVVMLMSFGPLNDGHPNKKRLEAKVVGQGKAWISTNGRTTVGTWRKTSMTGPTQFFVGGRPITLTVGQTFVEVLESGYPRAFKAGVFTSRGVSATDP